MSILLALCARAMGSGKTTIANELVASHGFERVAFATPLKQMAEGLMTALEMEGDDIKERVWGDRKEEPIPGIGTLAQQPPIFEQAINLMIIGLLDALGLDADEILRRMNEDMEFEPIPGVGWSVYRLRRSLTRFMQPICAKGSDITSRRLQQLLGTEFGRDTVRPSLWVDIAMAAADIPMVEGKSVVIDDMRMINEFVAVVARGGQAWRIVRPGAHVTSSHSSEGELDGIHMNEFHNNQGLPELLTAVGSWVSRI
jgi:hypothetical protein